MRQHQTFYGIDILRFSAALLVMWYHLGYKAWSLEHYYLNDMLGVDAGIRPWSDWTWFGWIGVQIFFVISGFVIAFSGETSNPLRFLKSRVTRLAPAMWLCASVCLLIAIFWHTFSLSTALWLFAKSLVFAPVGPWIAGQIWTLPIEIMFYVLIFVVLCFDAFRRIDWICLALGFASLAYWILINSGYYIDHSGRATALLLLQHGCYFALGMGLWLLTRRGPTPLNLLIIAVAVAPTFFQMRSALAGEAPGSGFDDLVLVPYLAWGLAILLMSASIYFNAMIAEIIKPARHVVAALGRITYPLYLVHFHVGGAVMLWSYAATQSPYIALTLATITPIAVAWVITYILEKPLAQLVGMNIQRLIDANQSLGQATFLTRTTRPYGTR